MRSLCNTYFGRYYHCFFGSVLLLSMMGQQVVPAMSQSPFVVANTIRVMHWDVSSSTALGGGNLHSIERVVRYVVPDVLVVQGWKTNPEVDSIITRFHKILLSDSIGYFVSGSDRVLYAYDANRLSSLVSMVHDGNPFDQSGIVLRDRSGNRFCLLAATWSDDDRPGSFGSHRQSADDLLAMALSAELYDECAGRVIVVGRFNASSSSDDGLRRMDSERVVSEPIVDIAQVSGIWDSVYAYANLHTSAATGVRGGLLTRPVMVALSKTMLSKVVRWEILGNDGLHFESDILDEPEMSHPRDVLTSLQAVSDVLPIVLDVRLDGVVSAPYVNPVSPSMDLR